jgi:peptidoglycan/xylan/chitin deacetylase (PgdA/CDA1 family)
MTLDIVMYHYVRPISESRYPKIKGLELKSFQNQLDFFLKEKNLVSTDDVINAVTRSIELPKNAIWLTFDDGYKDHFDYVAPILEQKGIDAAFFPVSDCYENGSLLDVNKIHYIIASVDNDESLLTHLFASMKEEGLAKSDFDNLWNSTNKSSRYDSEVVIFFKRMLQKNLPLEMRQKILTRMFNNLVGRSQKEVSKELYMSKDNLISLSKKGFHIGSHTSSHIWLNSQTDLDQEKEITKSLDALRSIRNNVSNWIMCYPYGGYNAATLSILEKMGCALALTTTIGEADLSCQNKFELKRWDTNDFPH